MARSHALLSLNLPAAPVAVAKAEKRTFFQAPSGWDVLSLPPTPSGEFVSELRALQISTVFACVSILAKSVGTLPLTLYRQSSLGKIPAPDHPLQFLLGQQPNPETPNAAAFWECYVAHLMLTGNAYAEISRNRFGVPVALWPLNPRSTQPHRDPETGALTYRTTDGMPAGQYRILQPEDVLHVPLFSHDGVLGLSPIANNREMLGASLSMNNFGAQFFANYATPNIVLTVENTVKPEDKHVMRTEWEKLQSGSNRHRVAVLDQGMKLEKISVTPDEAQFLESRRFSQSEIASIFSIPLHLIGSDEKLSRSNSEELARQFYSDTLQPIIARISQAIALKVLPRQPGRASEYSVNFVKDLSGDTNAVNARLTVARQWGLVTQNEGREMLGLPSIGPAGDTFETPANMKTMTKTGEYIATPQPTAAHSSADAAQ